jgi:putative Holliday junction resolvase
MRYIGLDLGSKTLGVATSDYTNTIATTLTTLRCNEGECDTFIKPLEEIINSYGITSIVLGLPKNMDNSLGERALLTLEFKKKLEEYFKLEVIMEDERLTSVISNNVLIKADVSRKKRKKKVDGIAAQIILQSFLDKEKNKNER